MAATTDTLSFVFTILVLLAASLPAAAAILRPRGTVHGDQVRVGDIWEGAGSAAELILGPGPTPGNSIRIGSAQLAALARAYGVDWPGPHVADITLVRPGVPLTRQAVLAVLGPALADAGAGDPAATQITLPGYQPPMFEPGFAPALSVEQMNYDAASGRFAAIILVTPATGAGERIRLVGTAYLMAPAWLAARRLQAGTILEPSDLIRGRVRARLLPETVTTDPAALVGRQVRHMILPGQPVATDDVVKPLVVTRRSRVLMALHMPGLEVAASGEAIQDGAVGDEIQVRNDSSGALLLADVVGPGMVSVAAGSMPAKAPVAQK